MDTTTPTGGQDSLPHLPTWLRHCRPWEGCFQLLSCQAQLLPTTPGGLHSNSRRQKCQGEAKRHGHGSIFTSPKDRDMSPRFSGFPPIVMGFLLTINPTLGARVWILRVYSIHIELLNQLKSGMWICLLHLMLGKSVPNKKYCWHLVSWWWWLTIAESVKDISQQKQMQVHKIDCDKTL